MLKDIKIRDIVELILLPLFAWAVSTVKDLSKNVEALNTNVAVIIANSSAEKERVNYIDRRLEKIEDSLSKQKR